MKSSLGNRDVSLFPVLVITIALARCNDDEQEE